MSIRYTLLPADYWRLNKYCAFQRRLRPAMMYALFTLFGLSCLVCLWAFVMRWHRDGTLDFFSLVVPIVIVFGPLIFKAVVLQMAKHSLGYAEETALTIKDQYVTTAARSLESKLGWAAIQEIVGTEDSIYFFLTKRSALILPKRVFPTGAEADAFLETAIAYKQNAVPGLAVGSGVDTGTWPPAPRPGS